MRNFPDVLDQQGTTKIVVRQQAPAVQQTTRTVLPQSANHLLTEEAAWDWRALKDYVVTEITQRHGPQPIDDRKAKQIFDSFLKRWGDLAVPIAKAAFTDHDGMWANAPISINRFCKNSDPFFAAEIAERLQK